MIPVFIAATLSGFIGIWMGKHCRSMNAFVAWVLAIPVSVIAGAVCFFVAEMAVAYCVIQLSDGGSFSLTHATSQALVRHFFWACLSFLWGFKSGRKPDEPVKQNTVTAPKPEPVGSSEVVAKDPDADADGPHKDISKWVNY